MRKLTLLGALAALLVGCTSATPKAAKVEPGSDKITAKAAQEKAVRDAKKAEAAAIDADADPRKIGDFVSFAFSGSFAKTPFVLTQTVKERSPGKIAVLFELAESGKVKERLLVETSTRTVDRGKVLAVSRVDDAGQVVPASADAFEALLARTVPATDQNDGLLASEPTKIAVGGTELDATRFAYSVRVGGKKAKMVAYSSDDFVWGDLGGEVKAESGKLLYKAEIVEMGSGERATASLK